MQIVSWSHMWTSRSSNVRVADRPRRRVVSHSPFSIPSAADDDEDDKETEKGKPDDQAHDGSDSPDVVVVIVAVSLEGRTVAPVVAAVVVAVVPSTGHLIILIRLIHKVG